MLKISVVGLLNYLMKLTLLGLIVGLNLYGQTDHAAYKRIEFGLETMIQSQINIGGIKSRQVDSENGKINAKNLMISPSLGLLVKFNINDLSGITTGIRISQYKVKLEFNYQYTGNTVIEGVRINRNVLEFPLIYSRKISKKMLLGAGIGFCFDEIGALNLSGKSKGMTKPLETEYLFTFGDGYNSFSVIAQGEYKLNRRLTLLAGFNFETISKKAFDASFKVREDISAYTFDYTYKPYTIRYSIGLKIKLFGREKKQTNNEKSAH